ncbi:MAG: acetoin dehydrogenase dihydrolipoyllysine-residue acetyltransferase subunit [Rhodospirillaceae bacterium]|nr:acetoin dehydrogenase dihydrolipoyllysine-residue acetyltransferase subunit [Rhodospirillaceae bacterium]
MTAEPALAQAPPLVLTLPRLGETMEQGRVVAWVVAEGQSYKRGETLLEVETDKTVVEVPALGDGQMLRHLVGMGDTLAVGSAIAEVAGDASAVPVAPAQTAATPATAPTDAAAAAPPCPVSEDPDRLRAAPSARRLARRRGVDLEAIAGSGRRGRIQRADVDKAAAPARPPRRWPGDAGADLGEMLDISGGRLFVRRWKGDGPPLLLLHGFAGDLTTYAATGADLSRRGHTVFALDMPGHGRSDHPADTPDGLAAAVADAIVRLDLSGVRLVGQSLGAAVAILVAQAVPDRIAALDLLAPAGLATHVDQSFVDGLLAAATLQALTRELAKLTVLPPTLSAAAVGGMLARLQDPAANAQLRRLSRHLAQGGVQQLRVRPALAGLAQPVRLMAGLEDRVIPWQPLAEVADGAALHLFREAGHMVHWDRPLAVHRLLEVPPQGGYKTANPKRPFGRPHG